MKIMFVCTGNICRSPLAEAVFRELATREGVAGRFEVDSSGTTAYHVGQDPDDRMKSVAQRHGVRIRHRSKQLTAEHLAAYDLILAMDRDNLREISYIAEGAGVSYFRQEPEEVFRLRRKPEEVFRLRQIPEEEKVKLFRDFDPQGGRNAEVPDPYYGGRAGFEMVYEIVDRTCRALLSRLLDGIAAPRA